MNQHRKKDGFNAQRAVVLPNIVIKQCEQHPIISNLHITDIGYYPNAEGHYRYREHGSPQNILIYCTSGKGWAKIGGRELIVEPGDYLILPKQCKHIYGADEATPWSIFWVHFKGSSAAHFVQELKKVRNDFTGFVSYDERRFQLFDDIYHTLEAGYSIDNLNYVNMQFGYFLATFCYPHIFKPKIAQEENEIEKVIRFMRDNIERTLSLEEIAAHVHRSVSHFCALFKKGTGYAPLEYFGQIRIQRACQLLEFSDLHIKEVAYRLGYRDPFYFSRLFSKFMGQSPAAYRKRKKIA
ncbi:helix-turn-helix domain-containing protein [Niabella hirudinis]|uniref:AraC family transcriptional regulator n=1 Tax=Niabella hirudinis TaxID=1285929 RepID=UPI003EBB3D0E